MDLVLRTMYVFILIVIVTRAVGRRELSSMEPIDIILLVVIGDLVQSGVTQSDQSLTLIADGRVIERNLRRQRMTVEELGGEARLQQIGSLDEVRYAVLESNGKISFLTRA